MRGLMLATDTVVIVIIAGAVLVLLLAFFKGTGGRGIDQMTLERQRSELCSRYLSLDNDCDGKADVKTNEQLNDIYKINDPNLMNVCQRLGIPNCDGKGAITPTDLASPGMKCLRACCMGCS
ncbi:MAG: hypothetical protein HZB66_00655 [Candidatus Aenigmarchaeota archaeon]|nr:hypothetical protein [Candidatus Aenigmarchaeota archaeon]